MNLRGVECAALGLMAIGCTVNSTARPPIDSRPMPTTIVASGVGAPEPGVAQIDGKRYWGERLEKLNFSKFPGGQILENYFYKGPVSILRGQLDKYSVTINPAQLNHILEASGINNTSNILQITFKRGNILEEEFPLSKGEPLTGLTVNIDNIFTGTDRDIDDEFEVDPDKRGIAADNLAKLKINIRTVGLLFELGQGNPEIMDEYIRLLVEGAVAPIVDISHDTIS